LWEIFYAGEVASTYNFQVSPLAKLQAFMFGRLGVVSPTIFVIVLCLGFALSLGFCSGVEVQKICGKLSWIGYWGFRLGFRRKAYRLKHFARFSANVTFLFKAFEIRWGKKASILGDHSIGVLIGKSN
jgi:hypothetical protein